MELVGGAGLELGDEVTVEGARLLRLAVREQTTAADVVADDGDALDDIAQQRCAQALPFVLAVDSQPGEQRDGLGVATGAFAQPDRRISGGDLGHRPRVVGHHVVVVDGGDYEHLRRAGGHRLAGVTLEPLRLL